MMCGCIEGRADVVFFLIEHGAKVDAPDEVGRTPLLSAVTKGDFDKTAKALISAGADINRRDKDGIYAVDESRIDEPRALFRASRSQWRGYSPGKCPLGKNRVGNDD